MKESKRISHEFSSVGATEILALADIKEHLYIDSANTSFDTRLTTLNSEVRQYLEEITGKSLIDKTVTIIMWYESSFNLPFGPLVNFDSASIKTGINEYEVQTVNEDYEVEMARFRSYVGGGKWKLVYDVGYTDLTLPEGLRLAWLNEIAKRFEHRGEEVVLLSQLHVNDLLNPYKDLEWLM
jgi:hypothetical protein